MREHGLHAPHVLTLQVAQSSCALYPVRALRADRHFLAAGQRCRGPSQAELIDLAIWVQVGSCCSAVEG